MRIPFQTAIMSFFSAFSLFGQTSDSLQLPQGFTFQGHRGARGLLPENTIPAFLKSLELGVHTLELDVVISADKQVVVSHEPWFNPAICSLPNGNPVTADKAGNYIIYQMPYDTVKQFDCGKRGNPSFARQQPQPAHKPLLKEVIEAADAYARQNNLPLPVLDIELKTENEAAGDGIYQPPPPEFVQLVYDIIQPLHKENRVIVQSFDVRILQAFKAAVPQLPLSYLIANPRSMEHNLKLLGFVPQYYSPNYRLISRRMLRKAHAQDMKLVAWTVNDLTTMRRLIALGINGMITDYPDLAAQILREINKANASK
ncbi:glycerophosphodiester phosphodiesterase [Sphingobacteriales bacterium UPWRP_1]|nr:glycerophosphodiester phosphodiesterase [Sphingobacteriales bacterium UPWRP_1]